MFFRSRIEYYSCRESEERSLALAAVKPSISALHTALADTYARIVADFQRHPTPDNRGPGNLFGTEPLQWAATGRCSTTRCMSFNFVVPFMF